MTTIDGDSARSNFVTTTVIGHILQGIITYLCLLHDLVALLPLVGLRGRLVVLEGLAEDELVVAATEGVLVHGHWRQVRVRVLALGLARRGAVIVPDGQL